MRADRTRKAGKEIVHYTHAEQRDNIISKIGYDKWKRSGHEGYDDIVPPACFADLFGSFIDLYYLCPTGVNYQDIAAYCTTNQNPFSVYEISLIRKMCSWAASEVNKAWRENH